MIVKYLSADVAVLQKSKLMDYSLLAGIVRVPVAEKDKLLEYVQGGDAALHSSLQSGMLAQPILAVHGEYAYAYYFGIIDFLQIWNTTKKMAQAVKFLEFNKSTVPPKFYGDRFLKNLSNQFKGDATA